MAEPITQREKYLATAAGEYSGTLPKPITREDKYLYKIATNSGGSGGTTDYEDLSNKPKINGVTLTDNKSLSDLGLYSQEEINSKISAAEYDDTDLSARISAAESGKVDKEPGKQLSTEDFTTDEKTKLSVLFENPLNHNGIYRGKNLTNVYTIDQMYNMIHSGNFNDLFLGDYFTVSITTDIYTRFTGTAFESGEAYYEMGGTVTDRTWTATTDTAPNSAKVYATKQTKTETATLMFAGFDYYYNSGDTNLTTHHAILIPHNQGFSTTAKMNATNTTEGGYLNSDMHQIVLPGYAKSLKTALNNHLLSHRTLLSNKVTTTAASMAGAGLTGSTSGWEWTDVELQLMNEVQLYGTMVWSSSAYDVGSDNRQLPVFKFIDPVQFGRNTFWLRSVVSSANFAYCHNTGYAYYGGASGASYVRPLILFG